MGTVRRLCATACTCTLERRSCGSLEELPRWRCSRPRRARRRPSWRRWMRHPRFDRSAARRWWCPAAGCSDRRRSRQRAHGRDRRRDRPDPERRVTAREFGATAVADGSPDGLRRALAQVRAVAGYGAALELSGAPSAVKALLASADLGAGARAGGQRVPGGQRPDRPRGGGAADAHRARGALTTRRSTWRWPSGSSRPSDADAFAAAVGQAYPSTTIGHAMLASRRRPLGARRGGRRSSAAVTVHD